MLHNTKVIFIQLH